MELTQSEDTGNKEEAESTEAAEEASPPPPQTWYTPLITVTPLSKTLAAILFIVLPMIGFWKGYQYGVVQRVQEAPLVAIEGEHEKQTESTTEHTEPKEEVWTKYSSEELGISFEYPEKLSLTEEGGVITLHHSIPYENNGDCDMAFDENVTYSELTDFAMSFELVSPAIEPPYVDGEFSAGGIDGVWADMGAEGCGQTYYYFDISDDATLLVKQDNIQALSSLVNTWNREAILSVSGVIDAKENKNLFSRILSSVQPRYQVLGSDIQVESMQESNDGSVKLRAIKKSATTTVFITNGDQRESEVFSFVESLPYEDSGNHWRSLPPNVSLSHDGEKIAFCDTEGIKMHNLATGETTVLRRHDVIKSDFIFNAYVPIWSPADEFLLYELSQYEGMRYGVLKLSANEFEDNLIVGFANQIEWLSYGDMDYLVYSSGWDGYATEPGLYVAKSVDLLNEENSFTNVTKYMHGDAAVDSFIYNQKTGIIRFNYSIGGSSHNAAVFLEDPSNPIVEFVGMD